MKIAINGFGRVGRGFLRAVYGVDDIVVTSINCTMSPEKCAHFLKWDSTHGPFKGVVEHGSSTITINDGPPILITNYAKPGSIKDADVVVECSGLFNKRAQAQEHLTNGVAKVLISAPSDKPDRTVIFGVNQAQLVASDQIISVGSCTSNCLLPVVATLEDAFGISSGFFVTVHAYTNDQRILDANHDDLRRARAGAVSIIPTSTGASKIVGEVFPKLRDTVKGSSLRVPVNNVSLLDFTFCTERAITVESLRECFKKKCSDVLGYTEESLVSVDFIGNNHSAVIDMQEVVCITNMQGRVLAWYDNEWGFVSRMVDVLRYMQSKELISR